MANIVTSATYGSFNIKGYEAAVMARADQADKSYVQGIDSLQGVEKSPFDTKIFKKHTTQDQVVRFTGISPHTLPQYTPEGEDFKEGERVATYNSEAELKQFTTGVVNTLIQREDRETDKALDEVHSLVISAKMGIDSKAFDIFNKAFTEQSALPRGIYGYGDGEPMCETDHPNKGNSGTQGNKGTTALSDASLETAFTALRNQQSDVGTPMNFNGDTLLVPIELEKTALQLRDSEWKSGVDLNDINVYYGVGLTIISTKWLNALNGGDDNNWFVLDSKNSPICHVMRKPIHILVEENNKNGNVKTTVRYRDAVINKDWRGVYGSAVA